MHTNSLLDDIEAEHHNHLLENGNLLRKRNNWSDDNAWTFKGYTARILSYKCRCGSYSETLLGIFAKETTPSGKSRETSLNLRGLQFNPQESAYTVETQTQGIDLCPNCIPLPRA